MDYRTHSRSVMEDARRQIRGVLEDRRYPNDQVRHEEALKVGREGQSRHVQAVEDAKRAYEAEVERLERQANPGSQRGQRTTAELLERRELLEQKSRVWDRTQGNGILDEYRNALASGDKLLSDLIEEYGPEYVRDPGQQHEFADLVYEQQRSRLPASAQSAVTQLEELVRDEGKILGGMAHQKRLMTDEVEKLRKGIPFVSREEVNAQRGIFRDGSDAA